jgi:hypothetical protein
VSENNRACTGVHIIANSNDLPLTSIIKNFYGARSRRGRHLLHPLRNRQAARREPKSYIKQLVHEQLAARRPAAAEFVPASHYDGQLLGRGLNDIAATGVVEGLGFRAECRNQRLVGRPRPPTPVEPNPMTMNTQGACESEAFPASILLAVAVVPRLQTRYVNDSSRCRSHMTHLCRRKRSFYNHVL